MGIRIVLVDDHALVRQALRVLLDSQPDFTIVAEAGDAAQAESAVNEHDPDVVVTDLLMPGPGGVELTRRLVRRNARRRIVVVTVYGTEMAALEALRSGAMGFVSKAAPASELFQAIREANAGRQYVSPPISKSVIERGLHGRGDAGTDPFRKLTSREREVLQLAAQGLSSPAIAKRLYISPRTAETHRARVMRKLSIRNQTELIFFAVKRGLLWIEPVPTPTKGARSRALREPRRTTLRSPIRPAPKRVRH
jgi:two-component system, NarL family, response regulator NreC